MTDTPSRNGGLLARIRHKLAEPAAELTAPPEPAAAPVPEPPRREHLYGSTYRVRMSFAELMRTRGHLGEQVLLAQRRSLASPTDAERQRQAATERAGYVPGEVMWPTE